jgi:hypothetical protein
VIAYVRGVYSPLEATVSLLEVVSTLSNGYWGLFLRVQSPRLEADHSTNLSIVENKNGGTIPPLPYRISCHSMRKVKLFLKQAMNAHRVVRRRGSSRMFEKITSLMTMRLSTLRIGRLLPHPLSESYYYSFMLTAESTTEAKYGCKDEVD